MRIFSACGFCGGISDRRVESDRADSWIDRSDNDLDERVRLLGIERLCSALGEHHRPHLLRSSSTLRSSRAISSFGEATR